MRRRLLTGYERLRPEAFRADVELIGRHRRSRDGDPRRYVVQESLRSLLALAGTNPERHVIRNRLEEFYTPAAASTAPEVHRLTATVEAWWPAIEAGITTGYSNTRSEGYHRLAKHEGRNAGFRNPANQHRRIRRTCTRQHRRVSAMINTLPGQWRDLLAWMQSLYGLERPAALALASTAVDMRVTQVANRVWGVHAVLADGAIGRTTSTRG